MGNIKVKGRIQMKLQARQGDVGFVQAEIPKSAKRISLRPFALGEVTGHSHRVVTTDEPFVEMYEAEDGRIFIRALKDISIQHEDHDPAGAISVLPKSWEGEVRIAREYDEESDFRRVLD